MFTDVYSIVYESTKTSHLEIGNLQTCKMLQVAQAFRGVLGPAGKHENTRHE